MLSHHAINTRTFLRKSLAFELCKTRPESNEAVVVVTRHVTWCMFISGDEQRVVSIQTKLGFAAKVIVICRSDVPATSFNDVVDSLCFERR